MLQQKLCFVNKSPNADPTYADDKSSGLDLRAWITTFDGTGYDNDKKEFYVTLQPFERRLIHTGIYFDIPSCFEIQVRPRSGLAIKRGLTVINTPGTVDEGYTGEVCVCLINLSNEEQKIYNGERIAQAVLCPVYYGVNVILEKIDEITKTTVRGSNGFGSTGLK